MKNAAQRLAWAVEVCRRAQMRPTQIRQKMLAILAAQRVPMSLETVMQADSIRGCCNATTAYRTLMLFKELEVIRQVSLPNKISYFVLNTPDESSHFLICRRCGEITELPGVDTVAALEREVAATRGYARLYHELEFFGVCPVCQKQPAPVMCAKLPIRTVVNGQRNTGLA
jgi:Fur family transcriptional regulator, ferric uptake regulator